VEGFVGGEKGHQGFPAGRRLGRHDSWNAAASSGRPDDFVLEKLDGPGVKIDGTDLVPPSTPILRGTPVLVVNGLPDESPRLQSTGEKQLGVVA